METSSEVIFGENFATGVVNVRVQPLLNFICSVCVLPSAVIPEIVTSSMVVGVSLPLLAVYAIDSCLSTGVSSSHTVSVPAGCLV